MVCEPQPTGNVQAAGGSLDRQRALPVLPAAAQKSVEEYRQHGELVRRVRNRDPDADELLHTLVVKSVRYRFIKEFGKFELAEDKIHDTYVLVLEAIRKGNVTDPERFIGYIQTIARRKIIHGIRSIRADRRAPNLSECEQIVTSESAFESRLKKEQSHIIGQAVIRLRPLERELYQRLGQMQDEETICREMKLTSTQFRLAKSRGKQRLVRYVRELLGQESKPLPLVPKRLAATQILPATASVNPRD